MSAIEWVVSVLAVCGGFLSLIAALGLFRLPDVYSRIHATGKSSVTGTLLIMSGTFIYFVISQNFFVGKLLLVIVFVAITTPVAALVVIRSAYRIKVPLSESSAYDELKPYYAKLDAAARQQIVSTDGDQTKAAED